ncbi:cupin domain-containing protein [Pontibacter cellulosilyticus]|uniref:Cupin domain-containing protein n=1 Tax=Pontibacter cellulosilyticus TaxID=1720253 RepID=A0A923SHQ5_9BACT|nr:cupin domain-containing protein [Pontibacter cellulosilyticus]MBC5991943.1 cupin domain-containing protein [Pontibacter cellulosilyticus]
METLQQVPTTTIADAYRNYQGGYFKVLLSPEQTGGSMALIDITLPKGVEPPVHVHTREDETFYLLEGEMTFHIGDKEVKAVAGEAVFAPRQVPHHFTIDTPVARSLTLITPGNFLDYFLEFSFPAAEELKIIHPQGPPPAEFIEHMTTQLTGKYGVLFM